MFLWKYCRDFFPVRLMKTVDLPGGRNYIVAVHHHAVFPFGTLMNFLTEANNLGKHFPGIDFRIVARAFTYIPITRDICLGLGNIY